MAKIGRNEPCPCGSGKKYKKCCLGRQERSGASQESSAQAPPSAQLMPPYVLAKLFEDSEEFAKMRRRDPQRAARFWTPRRVAAMDTEEIRDRLRKLGVDASPEAFLALAGDRTSAWGVSEVWLRAAKKPLSRHSDDFLGLSACELWKRYCPERPSVEMLDDWMQEGYEFSLQGELENACERWSVVWETIRSRLQPGMRTTDSAAVVFDGTQSLFNWLQDYALELHNAAIDTRSYAQTGIRLCREVLAQFPDEDELFILDFRADLGEFHFLAEQDDEGERVLLDLIRDHPDRAIGYERLSDILAFPAGRDRTRAGLQRAEQLLEQAIARPVSDAAVLAKQLDEVRKVKTDLQTDLDTR